MKQKIELLLDKRTYGRLEGYAYHHGGFNNAINYLIDSVEGRLKETEEEYESDYHGGDIL